MNTCPKCHTPVQPDAVFCEACGWLLAKPYPNPEHVATMTNALDSDAPALSGHTTEVPAPVGSLKEHLAVLAGPLRQMRAKWPHRVNKDTGAQGDTQPKSADIEAVRPKRSTKIISIIVSLVTGLALIAFWVWLLMRKTGEQLLRCFFK